MNTRSKSVRANERVIFTPLVDGTGVLLDLDTKFYFTLNRSGVAVWQRLATGRATIAELAATVVEQFDVGTEAAEHDVLELVDELIGESLAIAEG